MLGFESVHYEIVTYIYIYYKSLVYTDNKISFALYCVNVRFFCMLKCYNEDFKCVQC